MATEIFTCLHQAIHQERHVCYYLLDNKTELHTALATFVRINSGGMSLSAADLLFSALSTRWTSDNIRDVLKSLEQQLKQSAPYLHQTFILKTALAMVADKNLPVSLSNFKAEYIQQMKDGWPRIEAALRLATSIIFSQQEQVALDPIGGRPIRLLQNPSLVAAVAYYCFKADQVGYIPTATDRIRIRRWLIKAKLAWWDKQAAAETKLTRILRTIFRAIPTEANRLFPFPYDALCEEGLVDGSVNLWVQKEEANGEGLCIGNLLATPKGHQTTRFLLGLIQTNVHDDEAYEVDHCFPYRECRDSEDEDWQQCADSLPNLQLLESRLNSSKSDRPFREWYAALPRLLAQNNMSERLQATSREELSSAHAWPDYLWQETADQQGMSPREALFYFHTKRQKLVEKRLNTALHEN